LEEPQEAQSAFLESACSGDAELRAEVESLVAEQQRMTGFLNKPAVESTRFVEEFSLQNVAELCDGSSDRTNWSGTLLKGRYRIERELGSGGVGVVYVARDEQLHSRPVVIK